MTTDTKTIGISSLITLLIITAATVGPGFFEEDKFFCEERPELGVVSCDSFSKYVADNGKCIRDEDTNLICREGWMQVINDTELPEETEDPVVPEVPGAPGKQYECNQVECIEI